METPTAPQEGRGEAESMLAFAAYLRDAPDGAREDPEQLAARFALPLGVVRETLEVARLARRSRPLAERPRRRPRIVEALRALGRSMRTSPNVAAIALGVVPTVLAIASVTSGNQGLRALSLALWALLVPALVAINLARAQARYALSTALIAALMLTLPSLAGGSDPWLRFATGFSVSAVVFALFTLTAAMTGAYLMMQRELRDEERYSRLNLLERIFDLQGKLSEVPRAKVGASPMEWLRAIKGGWIAFSVASGVVLSLTTLAIRLTVGIPSPEGEVIPTPAQFVPVMAQLVLTVGLSLAAGFAAGQWRRALVAGVLIQASLHVMSALRLDGTSWTEVVDNYHRYPWALGFLGIYVGLSVLGGLGATVEARALRQRRLQAADHAALLSEIVRLQQVLNTGQAEVCALVVDCVKSTSMKQGEDPLKVEASFRAFHDFVETQVRRHSGSVVSVAGDGAVAEFFGVPSALAAAKEIQARLTEFNRRSNRLSSPFLVRIGLHCGQSHGGLDQIVFNEVIDIAAHVERAAPAGGIAATGAVRERLPDEGFAELASRVDGHTVHIVLNPVA